MNGLQNKINQRFALSVNPLTGIPKEGQRMPKINEIRRGSEIGQASKTAKYRKYIFVACEKCGRTHWVRLSNGHARAVVCKQCTKRKTIYRIPSGTLEKPALGDERKGSELGLKSRNWFVWSNCETCNTPHWTLLRFGVPISNRCINCRRKYPKEIDLNNPQIGDIVNGKLLGKHHDNYFIWSACHICGNPRWVGVHNGQNKICLDCYSKHRSGSESPQWDGGRHVKNGYIYIYLNHDDFFYPMADQHHYVPEHRLVVAKSLHRCLQPWENVHHKNGIKDDNRIENLELTMNGAHHIAHNKGYQDGYAKGLADGRTKQIEELKHEIRLLQLQVKERI